MSFQKLTQRADKESAVPETLDQTTALRRILETEYKIDDPSIAVRDYEINMIVLFRMFNARKFHGEIPREMDDKTRMSFKRLLMFINSVPKARAEYQRGRENLMKRSEKCLGDLVSYWRSLPDGGEMMKYKDIWEHVAQRPLAWECLPLWHPTAPSQGRRMVDERQIVIQDAVDEPPFHKGVLPQ
ncbi:MAG: hypothetical protein Q9220_000615 [cf. Caloplaca sp. 1 TL-2023]